MNKFSGFLLPIAIGLVSLQGCSTVDQRAEGIQAPAPAESITPVGVKVQAEVSAPAPAPVAAPAPAPEPAPAATAPVDVAPTVAPATITTATAAPATAKSVNQLSRYTVLPGDTLAGIASRQEVYGDARLWPFLYRSNVNQIGPRGLIFPNQILTIDRNHTADDVKSLFARPKVASAPPAMAAKPVSETPSATTATTATSAAASAAPAAATTVTTAAKPAAPTTSEAPKTSSAPGKSAKLSDYLNGAREAFAAGDTPWSIYYYSVYLGQKVNDAAAWGELGNVHYFDGNLMEAAQAFFNAANLFIDRGQTARALELISAIEEGDPGLAEALQLRLTTVKK